MIMKTLFQTLAFITAFGLGHDASNASAASQHGQTFATPREAVTALQQAAAANNQTGLRAIFGPIFDKIANPDLVQRKNEMAAFAAALRETNRLVAVGEKKIALEFGPENTSFPVPLIEASGLWFFDGKAGAEELINRRIGRNELDVLEAARTYVQAQSEYSSRDRDDDGVLEYAQKFHSTPRTKDGLHWPVSLDGTMSPLGPLVAEAEEVGYRKRAKGERQPFHGYYFQILTRQGKHAPGGKYDYIINKNMIAGFALVAWPAEYGVSGVMTFMVNQQGRVLEKDLGELTAKIASGMKEYDPDDTWSVSRD